MKKTPDFVVVRSSAWLLIPPIEEEMVVSSRELETPNEVDYKSHDGFRLVYAK